MEERIIGILRSISELLVATLIEETEKVVKVKNVTFLGISGQSGKVSIDFIPVEMLSLTPPVNVRNLLDNPAEDLVYTFDKSSVLKWDLKLNRDVESNYRKLTDNKSGIITPDKSIITPDKEIVKLF